MTLLLVFVLGIVAGVAGVIAALGAWIFVTARDLPEPKREDKE